MNAGGSVNLAQKMAYQPTAVSDKRLCRQFSRLLLVLGYLLFSSGCVSQQASNHNLPLRKAQLSLDEARTTQSVPIVAAGHYLDAAYTALGLMNSAAGDEETDIRLLYNHACQDLTVLLRSNNQLWNRTETIQSGDHAYRLRFAGGSQEAGTFEPNYFDFFRTSKQLRRKLSIETERLIGSGGTIVREHKPRDPRKFILPLNGLAIPATATVDFSGKDGDLYARFSLYRPV